VVLFPGGIVPPLASGRSVTEYVSLAYAIGSSAGASLVGSIRKPIVLIPQCAKVLVASARSGPTLPHTRAWTASCRQGRRQTAPLSPALLVLD